MQSSLPSGVAKGLVDSQVPGGGALLDHLVTAFRQGWERRQSRTYRAALATSGLSVSELQEAMLNDPDSQPMVTRALLHAAMINDGALLDALGAAWGRALADPTRLEDSERLVLGIAAIRPEDVQVLRVMGDREVLAVGTGSRPKGYEGARDLAHDLAAECDHALDSFLSSLVRLDNAGFLHASHGVFGGGTAYEVSSLGRLLREVLAAVE